MCAPYSEWCNPSDGHDTHTPSISSETTQSENHSSAPHYQHLGQAVRSYSV